MAPLSPATAPGHWTVRTCDCTRHASGRAAKKFRICAAGRATNRTTQPHHVSMLSAVLPHCLGTLNPCGMPLEAFSFECCIMLYHVVTPVVSCCHVVYRVSLMLLWYPIRSQVVKETILTESFALDGQSAKESRGKRWEALAMSKYVRMVGGWSSRHQNPHQILF